MNKNIKIIWKNINRRSFVIGIVLGIVDAGISIYMPKVVGNFLSEDFFAKIIKNNYDITLVIVALVLVYIIRGGSSFLIGKTGADATAKLQEKLWTKILSTSPRKIEEYDAGDLVSRLTNDIPVVVKAIVVIVPELLLNTFIVIGSVIFILSISVKLTLIALGIMLFVFGGVIIFNVILERYYNEYQMELGNISGILVQRISKFRIIKAFLAENDEQLLGGKKFNRNSRIAIKITGFLVLQEIIFSSFIVLIVILCITISSADINKGMLSISVLTSFVLYIIQIFGPLSEIIDVLGKIAEFKGVSKRIDDIFELENEVVSSFTQKPYSGSITFKEVSFNYGKNEILKQVSFDVLEGGNYVLLGPSGSGKTTIFNIILKFNSTYRGQVLIDNVELQFISNRDIRNNIAYIPQKSNLFAGTIRENLMYGKNSSANESRLDEILEILQIREFIYNLPKGLDTVINEYSEGLSEGQKQRINIARGFLNSASIILLDEVTANLDTDTENDILSAIKILGKDKTIIMTAHRYDAIKSMDKYIKLDRDGKIECVGETADL